LNQEAGIIKKIKKYHKAIDDHPNSDYVGRPTQSFLPTPYLQPTPLLPSGFVSQAASDSERIWIAAADGDESAVLDLLSKDLSAVNDLEENGCTGLQATTSYNHVAMLKKLVLEHWGGIHHT